MKYIPNEQLFKSDNIVFDNNKVWTKLSLFNDLLEIDRTSGNARVIPLPQEYDGIQLSHRCINKSGKTIYIIPFKARNLLVYDIEKELFGSHPIPENSFKEAEKGGYTQSAIIGDNLIMFGYHLSVLIFNIVSEEFTVVDGIKNMYSEAESVKSGLWSWVADGNILYIHIVSSKTVVELDVLTRSTNTYSVNDYKYIDGILDYKNGKFLSPYPCEDGNTKFIWWNKNGEEIDSIIVTSEREGGVRSFSWMTLFDEYIYCIPGSYSKTKKINTSTHEVSEVQDVPSVSFEYMHDKKTELELNYYSYAQMLNHDYCDADGLMITIHVWLGQLVIIDAKNSHVMSKPIELDEVSRKRLFYEQLECKGINKFSNNMVNEESFLGGLEGFIAFLTN